MNELIPGAFVAFVVLALLVLRQSRTHARLLELGARVDRHDMRLVRLEPPPDGVPVRNAYGDVTSYRTPPTPVDINERLCCKTCGRY